MAELKLTVRTADQTRRAAIEVDGDKLGSELIQTAADNWALPAIETATAEAFHWAPRVEKYLAG